MSSHQDPADYDTNRAECIADALALRFEEGIPNFDAGPPTDAEWDAIADLESAGAFDAWASPQVTSW